MIPGLGRSPWGRGMAACSSILAWRIPWTAEPGGATVHGVTKSQIRLSPHARRLPAGQTAQASSPQTSVGLMLPGILRSPGSLLDAGLGGQVGRWREACPPSGAVEGGVPAQVSPPSPCPSPVLSLALITRLCSQHIDRKKPLRAPQPRKSRSETQG